MIEATSKAATVQNTQNSGVSDKSTAEHVEKSVPSTKLVATHRADLTGFTCSVNVSFFAKR